MKKYKWLVLILTAVCCSFSANAGNGEKKAESNNKPDISIVKSVSLLTKSNQAADGSVIVCGSGYVVGFFVAPFDKNTWAVWLSDSGRWASSAKIYWAYGRAKNDNDGGKSIYAALLAAQASGQKVNIRDDGFGDGDIQHIKCEKVHFTPSVYTGSKFDSVEIWFP
ncbi:hypothetical protein ACP179_14575 [Xenorhabdus stockiae]|uniref:hypothetical protein n=1 Tax=Xenorhabdus stockiae TaxID=351614 RepID=UPI003CF151F1